MSDDTAKQTTTTSKVAANIVNTIIEVTTVMAWGATISLPIIEAIKAPRFPQVELPALPACPRAFLASQEAQ